VTKLHLTKVDFDQAPALESFDDRAIHQTREWLQFVSSTQKAEPVIAVVEDGDRVVGRFTGLIVKKAGVRILGSPFQGWTTSYMAFNLEPSVSRLEALEALQRFAFSDLGCVHFELMDRRISLEDAQRAGLLFQVHPGFEIDLSRSEDELFAAMNSACRRCIRKAEKSGVIIEQAHDAAFADDYYTQLRDVFAKQGLVPTYPKARVSALIEHLLPSGRLLLVRARSADGTCIATGIFPGMNDTTFFWGGASLRQHQSLRPNEAVQWFAMRYWKERGIRKYDMGGGGEYKRKYGGREIAVPWIRKSRHPVLESLRNNAKYLFSLKQRVYGWSNAASQP
jgi:predicted N-acyltransferase